MLGQPRFYLALPCSRAGQQGRRLDSLELCGWLMGFGRYGYRRITALPLAGARPQAGGAGVWPQEEPRGAMSATRDEAVCGSLAGLPSGCAPSVAIHVWAHPTQTPTQTLGAGQCPLEILTSACRGLRSG